jgi:hypothetical protein
MRSARLSYFYVDLWESLFLIAQKQELAKCTAQFERQKENDKEEGPQSFITPTGRVRTSSAKDTAASRLTPIHTGKGSAVGRSAQEINIPSSIPSPPVRVIGVVWREREFGRSSILRVLPLISHQIRLNVTINTSNGAVMRGKERLEIML